MARQHLSEYLKTAKRPTFVPKVNYFHTGDYVTYFFRDDRAYEDPVSDTVALYRSIETKEVVGVKITGVKNILQAEKAIGAFAS